MWEGGQSRGGEQNGIPNISVRRGAMSICQRFDVELEYSGGVSAEDFCACVFGEMAHLALDRFGGMRPTALMMRIVIGPEKVVGQIVLQRAIEADWIILERRESVGAEILTREHLEPRQRPHVML